MLYWIWFAVLTFVGWFFAFRAWNDSDSSDNQFFSHAAMLMALAMSWDVTGLPVYDWLTLKVPQPGSDIHDVTVLFLSGVSVIAWVIHPVFFGLIFMDDNGKIAIRNCWLILKKDRG